MNDQFKLTIALLTGALAASAANARANDNDTFPNISGEILIEVQNDWTFESEDPDSEINDLFTTTEPFLTLNLIEGLSIRAGMVLEPVLDPGPSDDRFFDDHGLFVETLSITYEHHRFALVGGKFTPNFGIAWDAAPGIYGVDFAEDYELAERIGIGASINLISKSLGTHALSASTFFLDNSVLSRSAFTSRGETDIADGGPSNTGDLSSFVIGLDGGEFPGLEGLRYHVAFAHQESGVGGSADERGFVIGIEHALELADDIEIAPIVEYAFLDNAGGVAGSDTHYLTAGASLGIDHWSLNMVYAMRRNVVAGAADVDDHLLEISTGYAFDFGVGFDVGWKMIEEAGVRSHVLGALISYTVAF